jgi:hypothetical protein
VGASTAPGSRIRGMASAGNGGGFLSEQKRPAEERSWLPWIAAGTVIVIAVVVVLMSGHRDRAHQEADSAVRGPDPYAVNLSIGNLKMSEAEKVTGVNVAVTFKNDVGEPPQVVPMPLSLIRTREPYVDIEPVSAEPLKPGETHEFRLIFDHISPVWNQQYPGVVSTRVQTR